MNLENLKSKRVLKKLLNRLHKTQAKLNHLEGCLGGTPNARLGVNIPMGLMSGMIEREQMIARQRVLANFGEFSPRSDSLDDVLREACRLVGDALGTDLAKIIEIEPNGSCLSMEAGVRRPPGLVGEKRLAMGERSSETYSIKAAEPVISKDISKEERFEFALRRQNRKGKKCNPFQR